MPTRSKRLNEIHFVDRGEFRQMAPSIVQLEITRLSDLLADLEPGSDTHTALVAARYQLSEFLTGLAHLGSPEDDLPGEERLQAAVVCLSLPPGAAGKELERRLIYVADRLGYILAQMNRLR